MQLSGGPYSYNRFEAFERSLEEGQGASDPHKMKAEVDAAAAKKRQESAKLKKGDKKQEAKQEKVTFGKVDEEAVDEAMIAGPRKDAMQKKSHTAKSGSDRATAFNIGTRRDVAGSDPEIKSRGGRADKRTGEGDRGMGNAAKRRMSEEELNNQETNDSIMENNDQRMAMYSRALGIMGAHYSGPGFGVAPLDEKKGEMPDFIKKKMDEKEDDAKEDGEKKGKKEGEKETREDEKEDKKKECKEGKDYDGDGKVESSSKEHAGAVHNAIQRAKGGKADGKDTRKEEVELTKEDVVQWMVEEGYANNEVSAEILHTHISDEFLEEIEERMLDEAKRAHQPGGAGEGQGQRPVNVGGFHGKVGGMGRDYKGDKAAGKKAADKQHADDRRAAAKERAQRRKDGEADNPLQAG